MTQHERRILKAAEVSWQWRVLEGNGGERSFWDIVATTLAMLWYTRHSSGGVLQKHIRQHTSFPEVISGLERDRLAFEEK